jgi:hypothetical protein
VAEWHDSGCFPAVKVEGVMWAISHVALPDGHPKNPGFKTTECNRKSLAAILDSRYVGTYGLIVIVIGRQYCSRLSIDERPESPGCGVHETADFL